MRGNKSQCRVLKRCFLCSVTISIIPIIIIFLATPDQLNYRTKNFSDVYENETQFQTFQMEQHYSSSEMEIRMQHRLDHLQTKCSEYGLDVRGNDSLHKPNPWEFLINKKFKLVWCNVFKAASTSWMYNFNLLAGYHPYFLDKTNIVPLVLARRRYSRPREDELLAAVNISTTFLIVRHPFERLLSAYNDKLRFALPQTFHQKLGFQIIRKYRKKKLAKGNQLWPTFPEFVSYLIDKFDNHEELDMHWVPITNFCTPCQVKFDIIAKFETLDSDQDYLIDRAKLRNLISPQWKNPGKGKNTKKLIMDFYAQLTNEQLQKLYNHYRYDFELFGYSADKYFEAILPESTTHITKK